MGYLKGFLITLSQFDKSQRVPGQYSAGKY